MAMRHWLLLALLAAVPARAGLEATFADLSSAARDMAKKGKRRKIFPLVPFPALHLDAALPAVLVAPIATLRGAALSAVTAEISGRASACCTRSTAPPWSPLTPRAARAVILSRWASSSTR